MANNSNTLIAWYVLVRVAQLAALTPITPSEKAK